MSDKAKQLTGLFLVLTGIVLSLIHVLTPVYSNGMVYRTGSRIYWQLGSIPAKQDGIVRINDAGEEELETLPGIGKVYASMLIEEREKNGIFFYPEDLTAVKGIGKGKLGKIYQDIDLTMEKGEKDGVSSTIP